MATIRRALLPALLAITVAAVPSSVDGVERERMAVSPSEPKQQSEFGPIPGNNTSLPHKPSDCRTASYCDTIPVDIDSRKWGEKDVFVVDIVLEWGAENVEDPTTEGSNLAQSGDLDLYLYDSNELRIGQAATANPKEQTQLDRPAAGLYYLVVNNFAGGNTGYTMTLELEYKGKLKEIPTFSRPTAQPVDDFAPDAEDPIATPGGPETELKPDATLAPVVTPGPDGDLTTLALDGVPVRRRVEDGASWWAIALAALAAAAALGLGGVFGYRRLRARRS